jgi:hypothetical protein
MKQTTYAKLGCTFAMVSLLAGLCQANAVNTIYFDSFSGNGLPLNGLPVQVGGQNWVANAGWLDSGQVSGVAAEGSALLPFDPVVNTSYTLSLDVLNPSGQWIGLGFARDPLASPGGNNIQDRFPNEIEGISWMLLRNSATANADVQVFRGLRTSGQLYSGDPITDFTAWHNLAIVIDTTGDGTSFTAQFFVDNVALFGAPQLVSIPVADINFVGMSFDAPNTAPDVTVRFDSFLLTQVPEPASGLLLALGGLLTAFLRRR